MDCLVASLDITNTNDIKTPETNATKTEITPETNENDLDNVWNCWLHCKCFKNHIVLSFFFHQFDLSSLVGSFFV